MDAERAKAVRASLASCMLSGIHAFTMRAMLAAGKESSSAIWKSAGLGRLDPAFSVAGAAAACSEGAPASPSPTAAAAAGGASTSVSPSPFVLLATAIVFLFPALHHGAGAATVVGATPPVGAQRA